MTLRRILSSPTSGIGRNLTKDQKTWHEWRNQHPTHFFVILNMALEGLTQIELDLLVLTPTCLACFKVWRPFLQGFFYTQIPSLRSVAILQSYLGFGTPSSGLVPPEVFFRGADWKTTRWAPSYRGEITPVKPMHFHAIYRGYNSIYTTPFVTYPITSSHTSWGLVFVWMVFFFDVQSYRTSGGWMSSGMSMKLSKWLITPRCKYPSAPNTFSGGI